MFAPGQVYQGSDRTGGNLNEKNNNRGNPQDTTSQSLGWL